MTPMKNRFLLLLSLAALFLVLSPSHARVVNPTAGSPAPDISLAGATVRYDAVGPTLDRVREGVAGAIDDGKRPIIVVGIDGAILDNRPRTRAIFNDYADQISQEFTIEAELMEDINSDSLGFFVVDNLRRRGIENLVVVEGALKYWSENFFTSRYTDHDAPVAGAAEFLTEMHGQGAMIIYLTSRNRPGLEEGTLRSLRSGGFPIDEERTQLVMRPNRQVPIDEFRADACEQIAKLGRVVATFEADPRQVKDLKRRWPRAVNCQIHDLSSLRRFSTVRGVFILDSFQP